MHLRIRLLMGIWLLVALAGCGPEYDPPDVKTNPNPTQRYAITVTLVDPPPGIHSITGMTHFVPGNPCRPLVNSIAGVAVSANYGHTFSLSRVADSTYRGHIYLDWPVDEDYYGLGVCEWELRVANILLNRADYSQHVTIWKDDVTSSAKTPDWWCPIVDYKKTLKDCFRPEDDARIARAKQDHFRVILSTQRN